MICYMPVLECPGVFSMTVNNGWNARRNTGAPTYELTCADDTTVAIHISVYSRSDGAIRPTESRELLELSLRTIGAERHGDLRVVPESGGVQRAFVECEGRDPTGGALFYSLVAIALWQQHFVVCSCSTTRRDSLRLREANRMFASIDRLPARTEGGGDRMGPRPAGADSASQDSAIQTATDIADRPGWLPDPWSRAHERFWDGSGWTHDRRVREG